VVNVIVLFIGIFEVKRGIKLNHLGLLNLDYSLLLFLLRVVFFDTDLSFVLDSIYTIGLDSSS
jgi:hypothetical protein